MVAKANAVKLADYLLELARSVKPTAPRDEDALKFNRNAVDFSNGFTAKAEELGFVVLGNGHYSVAFSHPSCPGYVVKVCIRSGDVAPAYLAWCRAHPGPHVPRVHHLRRHGRYTVAVLDLLVKMDCNRRLVYGAHLDPYIEKVSDHPVNRVAHQIKKFFDGACTFDLHAGNVMMDMNYQLVITDPMSENDSRESRALLTGIERSYDIAA